MPVHVTVRGAYNRPDQTPAQGSVSFTLTTPLKDAAGNVVFDVAPVRCVLDAQGRFTTTLVATDDPTLSPSGAVYTVAEHIRGVQPQRDPWQMEIPTAAEVAGIDLADVVPATAGPQVFSYALATTVADLESRFVTVETEVAALGAAEVTDAELAAAVEAEAALRAAADTALDGRLDTVEIALPAKVEDADLTAAIEAERTSERLHQSATYSTLPEALRPTTRTPLPFAETVISTLQAGHGWVADGAGTSNLNDTSVFTLGSQSAAATSNGTGGAARLTKTGMALDMTGKILKLKLRVSDRTKLNELFVYLGSGGWANFYNWTIYSVTGGDTINTWPGSGEWIDITIPLSTPSAGTGTVNKAAVDNIRVVFHDRSTGPVTVNLQKVSFVPEPTTQWPTGVVSLTFDDGWASQFTEAKKRMDARGFAGTAYTICDLIGTPGYLSLAQLRQMQNDSGWEIAPHAFTIANHNRTEGFTELTDAEQLAEFAAQKKWHVDNGFWRGADHLAWPRSRFDARTIANARSYFASGRTTQRTHESWPPAGLFRLRSLTVGAGTSVATVQAAVAAAKANKSWLILTFHEVVTPAPSGTQITPTDFQTIIDYINTQGVPVRTVGDVLRTA